MNLSLYFPFIIAIGVLLVLALGLIGVVKAFYVKVPQGTALIVNDLSSTPKVHFTGALVIPVLYKAEQMQIKLINLDVDRRGKEGLICKDNMRADIKVSFYLRVNEQPTDVLKVAKTVGAERASDRNAVDELFNAKFSEALKTVGKRFDFVDLFDNRQAFRDAIIEVIGKDLNGYVLEDVAIDYLEQTKKSDMDPTNIMDAEGIKKITELTAQQAIRTNELEQDEKLQITKKNTITTQAMLEMQRQEEEARAKQARQIAEIQAREKAEADKVLEESRAASEAARLRADESIKVQEQEQLRAVEVAEQGRLRVVAIEQERVNRAAELEKVTTDQEVQLKAVDRDKVVEQGRMEVANVIRERTAIEQTVAVQEEKIKETREVSAADRDKQVRVLAAEAEAQQMLVKDVKAAEAAEVAARHLAAEKTTLAEAELVAAGKTSEAMRVRAEGVKAEVAAPGLAEAQVRHARADASKAEGLAEAVVLEAKAEATYKQGSADAKAATEMGRAKADATAFMGEAEAKAIGQRMSAEAEGLTGKFEAMGKMSPEARAHEEFRMALETNLRQLLTSIEAGKEVSRENASVLAKALESAKIELIGGDGGVFDALTKGVSIGKAIEGITSESPLVGDLLKRLGSVAAPKALSTDSTDA